MEEFARNVAFRLSIVVELCAAAVIALLKFTYAYAITLPAIRTASPIHSCA